MLGFQLFVPNSRPNARKRKRQTSKEEPKGLGDLWKGESWHFERKEEGGRFNSSFFTSYFYKKTLAAFETLERWPK